MNDDQEPSFLDASNMPRRRRAGRHHREYRPEGNGVEWVKVGLILAFIAAATAVVAVLVVNQMAPKESATDILWRAIMEEAVRGR